jgi:pimeloyl-[acyl-carrier protein] methyl ester esterase
MPIFVTPDDVKLNYQIAGRGKPLLFLHGWAMCSRVWKYQVESFSRDFQVICLDLPGHGISESPPGPCDFTTLTRDVARFIEGLQLEKVTLIGWSLAVSLAVKLVSSHPLSVDSLVLVDGTPSFMIRDDFPHGLPSASIKRMLKLIDADFSRALKEFNSLLLSEQERVLTGSDEIWDLLTNECYLPGREVARSLLVALAREDLREMIATVSIPVLLMHGDEDKICLPGASRYMKEHLERAEMVTFPGAGHAPFLTQAGYFNHTLDGFLKSL